MGTDFFSVEVWTARGLTTYYVLFMLELERRRVWIAGITRKPDEAWMLAAAERARGFLKGKQYRICDRDAKFTLRFRLAMQELGVQVIRTPYQAPNANAHPERFVRSIKEECLDQLILMGRGILSEQSTSTSSTTTMSARIRGCVTSGSSLIGRWTQDRSGATSA